MIKDVEIVKSIEGLDISMPLFREIPNIESYVNKIGLVYFLETNTLIEMSFGKDTPDDDIPGCSRKVSIPACFYDGCTFSTVKSKRKGFCC